MELYKPMGWRLEGGWPECVGQCGTRREVGPVRGSAVTQAGTVKAVDSPETVGCNGGSEEWLWEVVETTQVREGLNREGGRERQ